MSLFLGHQGVPACTQEIASTVICEQLVKARVNPSVKAVVMRVDSPGGTILNMGSCSFSCVMGLSAGADFSLPSILLCSMRMCRWQQWCNHALAGGSAIASDTIYREILRVKAAGKPVVVSMGNVAASGGYYISAPATKIVAQPSTVTGSIGVVSLAQAEHSADNVLYGPAASQCLYIGSLASSGTVTHDSHHENS